MIENEAFRVAGAAGHGALTSVFDKAGGRELLTRPGNDLVLQEEYQQHPRWNEGPWHLSPKGPGLALAARSRPPCRRSTARRGPGWWPATSSPTWP